MIYIYIFYSKITTVIFMAVEHLFRWKTTGRPAILLLQIWEDD